MSGGAAWRTASSWCPIFEGDQDDPTFSLTGEGTLQTAVAVAKAFGASFEGLVRAFLIILNGFASAFRALAPA